MKSNINPFILTGGLGHGGGMHIVWTWWSSFVISKSGQLNVTKESIEKVIAKTLKSKPTIASIGPINNLEKIDKIESRFN